MFSRQYTNTNSDETNLLNPETLNSHTNALFVVFSVQIYPCDSKPCINGATCSNDDQDVSLYHCHCTGDYSGKNCQGTKGS